MKKEKLKEILTEMIMTSPSRDWSWKTHLKEMKNVEKIRNENLAHIDIFAGEIIKLFNQRS